MSVAKIVSEMNCISGTATYRELP